MATMGVRWVNNGGGANYAKLADVFAKSFFGDPEMDLKIAKWRDDQALQKYQEAQYQSATDYNNARTAAQTAELDAIKAAGPVYAKIIGAGQNLNDGQQASAAPAPVEPIVPTPTERSRYAPAPGQIGAPFMGTQTTPATPEYRMPATVPVVSDQRQFEPDFRMEPTFPVVSQPDAPLQEDRASRYRLPAPVYSSDRPTSVDEAMLRARAPEGAGPINAGTLNALQVAMAPQNNLASIPPELRPAPVRTLEEDRLTRVPTPPVPPERPSGAPAVSVPGRPAGPLDRPEGAPGMTIPGIPERTTPLYQDRPPPVSPGLVPPPPDSGPPAPTGREATGDFLPDNAPTPPAQVIPGPTPDTVAIKKANGQVKVLDQEDLAVLGARVSFQTDAAGQAGKLASQLEVLTSPTLTPDQKAAMLQGDIPSRESILGTDEAIRHDLAVKNLKDRLVSGKGGILYETIPDGKGGVILKVAPGQDVENALFPGDGDRQANNNVIINVTKKIRTGQPISPEEKQAYAMAYNGNFDPKTTTNFSGGQQIATTIVIPPPQGTLTPDQVAGYGGANAPIPAPAAPAAAPAPAPAAAPAAAAPAAAGSQPAAGASPAAAAPAAPAQPAAGAPAQATPQREPFKNYGGWKYADEPPTKTTETTPLPGGGTATTVTTGDKQITPSGQSEIRYGYAFNALQAMKYLNEQTDGLSMAQHMISMLNQTGEKMDEEWIKRTFSDEKSRMFARASQVFVNAALARPESGAAVSASEWAKYLNNYVIGPNATPAEYVQTRQFRDQAVKAIRLSLNGMIRPEALRAFDQEAARLGIDLDWQPPAGWDQPQGGGNGGGGKNYRKNPDGTYSATD